jgi:hypothetical protein
VRHREPNAFGSGNPRGLFFAALPDGHEHIAGR